ncbi:hypothetical protein BOTBODRAFT_315597 [Botryobasidium botryosum FD-172 SS1]|uniref:Uncharacterized protein n=1 Tax=Botryobasidium botryosum (strain FD-172 SS1) TaxID=930990 RepID=A0A067NA61_BOTB1|nr:hypothetical protein BOTBODRAFT_315597 [Botryobasidium botryosum FD-172 SS1]
MRLLASWRAWSCSASDSEGGHDAEFRYEALTAYAIATPRSRYISRHILSPGGMELKRQGKLKGQVRVTAAYPRIPR